MTVLEVSGWILSLCDSSLPGRSLRSFFFSSPISDVQSILPHPFPSPSFFSHTLKVISQLLIACVNFLRWIPLGSLFFLRKSSLSSHSIASFMSLESKTVILSRRWSASRTMWSRGTSKRGASVQPYSSFEAHFYFSQCEYRGGLSVSVTWL